MITKKLIHNIQTWLNSIYNFNNSNDKKNKHIITSVQNFAFKFIEVNIRVWSLRDNGTLYEVEANYNKSIKSEEDFIEFKDKVNSTIDDYIRIAIDITKRNEEYGN